jgi:hypothetical protein
LTALGGLGADLMTFTDWKSRLLSLETIDWSKKKRTLGSEGLHIRRQRDGGHPAGVGGYEASWSEKSGWMA